MSLHKIKVEVNNGLTMLFIVTNREQNITLFTRPNIMCVRTLLRGGGVLWGVLKSLIILPLKSLNFWPLKSLNFWPLKSQIPKFLTPQIPSSYWWNNSMGFYWQIMARYDFLWARWVILSNVWTDLNLT